jgi:hypothetical protein
VLISAHGNSLRALVKHLSGIPDDEITGLEIPTGQPIVYELDDELAATERYYLKDAPLVGIIMGSRSDWETMRHAAEMLDALGVPHETRSSPPTARPTALRLCQGRGGARASR